MHFEAILSVEIILIQSSQLNNKVKETINLPVFYLSYHNKRKAFSCLFYAKSNLSKIMSARSQQIWYQAAKCHNMPKQSKSILEKF